MWWLEERKEVLATWNWIRLKNFLGAYLRASPSLEEAMAELRKFSRESKVESRSQRSDRK